MPAGFLGDFRAAGLTNAVLSEPDPQQFILPVQVVFHLSSLALFKISFPRRVVRIGCRFDFDVPFDWGIRRLRQPDRARLSAPVRVTRLQDVVVVTDRREVTVVTPRQRLARMSDCRPSHQSILQLPTHL